MGYQNRHAAVLSYECRNGYMAIKTKKKIEWKLNLSELYLKSDRKINKVFGF